MEHRQSLVEARFMPRIEVRKWLMIEKKNLTITAFTYLFYTLVIQLFLILFHNVI